MANYPLTVAVTPSYLEHYRKGALCLDREEQIARSNTPSEMRRQMKACAV